MRSVVDKDFGLSEISTLLLLLLLLLLWGRSSRIGRSQPS
jgi:hypothetical protein